MIGILKKLQRRLTPTVMHRRGLALDSLESHGDYLRHVASHDGERRRRRAHELALLERGERFEVEGFCYPCGAASSFAVDYDFAYEVDGVLTPNWRERLVCPRCGLNNRMRAAIHLFEQLLHPSHRSALFLTEESTPLFQHLAARYPGTVGSEYLGEGMAPGEIGPRGLRHEDLTGLSFADDSFDFILSFDVLEHVPDYRRALAECRRVLRPGGVLFFTVPFLLDRPENTVRARVTDDGEIEHLMPPEYHGDPLREEGCLAFYHFGWELLDDLRAAGFDRPRLHLFWSAEHAYLGGEQWLLTAE